MPECENMSVSLQDFAETAFKIQWIKRFASAQHTISRQVWSWEWDLQIRESAWIASLGSHQTRNGREKNTADSSVQQEVQSAFSSSSPVFGVMTHFISLLRRLRWYGDNKQSREISPKPTLDAYQSDSPFCIPLATKEVFLIRLSPPALSAERRSYIHLHSFHTWQWRCSSIFTCKLPRD